LNRRAAATEPIGVAAAPRSGKGSAFALACVAVGLIALGVIGERWTRSGVVQERRRDVPRPAAAWIDVRERRWQAYLEQCFLDALGRTRRALILAYNEARLRLFPTRPNENYVWTESFGFYPVDSIQRLNFDILHRGEVEAEYTRAARRLRVLQVLLERKGVRLLVVPAVPKVRVYPEFVAPYLVAPASEAVGRAVTYGDILEREGVHVVNSQRYLRERRASAAWPFFTATSFHWSYLGGCQIAGELARRAADLLGRQLYPIDCSNVAVGPAKWADRDIVDILNIVSRDRFLGSAPFPDISPLVGGGNALPRVVLVGDSFSDQLVYAMGHAMPPLSWAPGWLAIYPRLSRRETIRIDGERSAGAPATRDDAASEAMSADILVIEESDGDVYRSPNNLDDLEFGLTRALLETTLARADCRAIDVGRLVVDGWTPDAAGAWVAAGSKASIALRAPQRGDCSRLVMRIAGHDRDSAAPHRIQVRSGATVLTRFDVGTAPVDIDVPLPALVLGDDGTLRELQFESLDGTRLDLHLEAAGTVGREPAGVSGSPGADGGGAARPHAWTDRAGLPVDVLAAAGRDDVATSGLAPLEGNGAERWRWALGSTTRVLFYVQPAAGDARRRVRLDLGLRNALPIKGQSVAVKLNGMTVRHLVADVPASSTATLDVRETIDCRAGVNVLEFDYGDWNHGRAEYVPGDPRPLAMAVMRFGLELAD